MKTNILLSILSITLLISMGYNFAYNEMGEKISRNSIAKCGLKTQMHAFWEANDIWTRTIELNVIDDLPGNDIAVDRLFKIQNEIAEIFKPYYGKHRGSQLSLLFHISAIHNMDMLKAIKTMNVRDTKTLEQIRAKWKQNANAIAFLLCKVNPNWKLNVLKTMLYDQITQLTSMAIARKNKFYVSEIGFYDKLRKNFHDLSDTLSLGIVKHFPDKFGEVQAN